MEICMWRFIRKCSQDQNLKKYGESRIGYKLCGDVIVSEASDNSTETCNGQRLMQRGQVFIPFYSTLNCSREGHINLEKKAPFGQGQVRKMLSAVNCWLPTLPADCCLSPDGYILVAHHGIHRSFPASTHSGYLCLLITHYISPS